MGKEWDSSKGGRDQWVSWLAAIMSEALRVLKPGGHALVWSLPRTSHWTALALEDAGFEIRDSIEHIFGSGFPKSHDISKAIDKLAGAEREVIGSKIGLPGYSLVQGSNGNVYGYSNGRNSEQECSITAPATPAAQAWDGWGTALKPAHETWWLARKPLAESTIAENVLSYGTGALNIDASRVGDEQTKTSLKDMSAYHGNQFGKPGAIAPIIGYKDNPPGRWPANLLLSHTLECQSDECSDDCPIRALDEQSGILKNGGPNYPSDKKYHSNSMSGPIKVSTGTHFAGDQGGASRYFQQFYYAPKPSRRERSAGCEELPKKFLATMNNGIGGREHNPDEAGAWTGNNHPTVKSINLMRYLISMITPENGIVLDMFGGSGSTALAAIAEKKHFILIEREQEYFDIANARIAHYSTIH